MEGYDSANQWRALIFSRAVCSGPALRTRGSLGLLMGCVFNRLPGSSPPAKAEGEAPGLGVRRLPSSLAGSLTNPVLLSGTCPFGIKSQGSGGGGEGRGQGSKGISEISSSPNVVRFPVPCGAQLGERFSDRAGHGAGKHLLSICVSSFFEERCGKGGRWRHGQLLDGASQLRVSIGSKLTKGKCPQKR